MSNNNDVESSCETEQSCCSTGTCCGSQSGTIKYDDRKIGRNETCPCGSNKKFKKCCGRRV